MVLSAMHYNDMAGRWMVPDGDEGPGTWDSTQQCTEGTGCQQREQAQIQEPLHAVIADAQQSLQIVLQDQRNIMYKLRIHDICKINK